MHDNELIIAEIARTYSKLFVLTGAGVSTDSGIPGYRDKSGQWKASTPIQGPEFKKSVSVQKRYWARSLIGWKHFGRAHPNIAHRALAEMESLGVVNHLLTQNVDGLHQRAGSKAVTDLHGRLDTVICLGCAKTTSRQALQSELAAINPNFNQIEADVIADGDAQVEHADFSSFKLVCCQACGGALKPNVVFFGENVPKSRVDYAMQQLTTSDAMLIAGSSLMVYSGYRFCLKAHALGVPIVAINQGSTRADHLLTDKIASNTGDTLEQLLKLFQQKAR